MPTEIENRNILLARLSDGDRDMLRPHLRPVDLPVRRRLAEANKAIDEVYFLDRGVASMTTAGRRQLPVEIGIIGREGVVNLPAIMGADQSPHSTYMQVAGAGHSIDAETLRDAMVRSASLTRVLLQYAHLFMVQASSTVLANGRGTVDERLARWLLMAADRQDDYDVPLTHEFLAIMLGVRRAGVTTALRELEARSLVRRGRGVVHILDRSGLEAVADGFYGIAEAEYARIFGPTPSP